MVQYVIAATVANVFTTVTAPVREFLLEHLVARCHRAGPLLRWHGR